LTYDSVLPDREGIYAKQTGEFLGIPIQFFPFDCAKPFDRWNDPEFSPPEPVETPFFAAEQEYFRQMAADCRVALSGEGSDNLMLFEMWPYLRHLWRERNWTRLFRDGAQYLWVRPFPLRGIRGRLKRLLRRPEPVVPAWIAPDLARQMNLEERSREFAESLRAASHPLLPSAHASLALPQWSNFLESNDPGATRSPVEIRYPFLDLRIVDYLLSLPPFPWAFQKNILREAMAGRLPDTILLRRKTPLAGDPVAESLKKKPEAAWMNRVAWDDQIARFVDLSQLRPAGQIQETANSAMHIRPHCLNFWLQSGMRLRYKLGAEARNG
jgi:asparagine synthase (glutamine-hydrolysing)